MLRRKIFFFEIKEFRCFSGLTDPPATQLGNDFALSAAGGRAMAAASDPFEYDVDVVRSRDERTAAHTEPLSHRHPKNRRISDSMHHLLR